MMTTHTDIDTTELYDNLKLALKNGCALVTGPTPILAEIYAGIEKTTSAAVCHLKWPVTASNTAILLCDIEALITADMLNIGVREHKGSALIINYSEIDENNELVPAMVWCDDDIIDTAIFWLLQGLAASNGSFFVPGEQNAEIDTEPSDIECTDP